MNDVTFTAAAAADVDVILEIIRERMDWMDEVGLRQWNATDYLNYYPRSYFEAGVARGDFYLMKRDGEVIGEMALFEKDGRWDDDPNYYYVHHLAVRPGFAGAGASMLRFAEQLGREHGKTGIRLDSAVDNPRLSAYYEALGYPAVSGFVEDDYEGLRRVKYLDHPVFFREATAEDLEELWEIEGLCFPPEEMCLRENFERRMALCPEKFLLLCEEEGGRICGFVSDVCSRAEHLTDDLFGAEVVSDPAGDTLMVLGVNVRPDCEKRGYASMLMRRRIAQARAEGLRRCVLTCHDHLVPFYAGFGYEERGMGISTWGGTPWHEMVLEL